MCSSERSGFEVGSVPDVGLGNPKIMYVCVMSQELSRSCCDCCAHLRDLDLMLAVFMMLILPMGSLCVTKAEQELL